MTFVQILESHGTFNPTFPDLKKNCSEWPRAVCGKGVGSNCEQYTNC